MKRSALLLATLAVVVPAAGAKEPAVAHATAVLAVVGGEATQPKLVWLDPFSLRRLKRGVVKLSSSQSAMLSPNGSRVAVGSYDLGIRIAGVRPLKLLPGSIAKRPGWTVSPLAWSSARRLHALEWSDRLGSRLAVTDPATRRVVTRIPVDGYSTWAPTANGVVGIGRPDEGIGPASLLVVDRDGATRRVRLDRISAGGEQAGTEEEPVQRMAWPGLAVDLKGHVAYVMGKASLVAQIDLESLDVTYRALSPVRSTAARTKMATGWVWHAVWLGEGQLAVAGVEYDRFRSEPAGLELVDVKAGTVRSLEGRATNVLLASGRLLVAGESSDGNGSWKGMGLAGYATDGTKLWHALDGAPVSWVQAAGGYAYVVGPESDPRTLRVIDLADGSLRVVRGQMPLFVTG